MTTTLHNQRLKKVQKKLTALEGAVGLLANRLHNAETMLCKVTAMAISLADPKDIPEMRKELQSYFECSDSLGAFESEAYIVGAEELLEEAPGGLRLVDCEPTENEDDSTDD